MVLAFKNESYGKTTSWNISFFDLEQQPAIKIIKKQLSATLERVLYEPYHLCLWLQG